MRRFASVVLSGSALVLAVLGWSGCASVRGADQSGNVSAGLALGNRARGAQVFAANCAVCHGASGAGGVGPALTQERKRKTYPAAVAWIEAPAPPMPHLYPAPLSQTDVEDVATYVEAL